MDRKIIAATVLMSVMTASAAFGNDSGRGRHKQFYVVPKPGAVTIDGKLDDWDLSGQIEMFVVEDTRDKVNAKLAAMYDEDAFYLSGEIIDESPMMNRHDPMTPSHAWDADAVQFRLILDPSVGYPVKASVFDYRPRNPEGKEDTRDDIVHMLLWHYTDAGAPYLQMNKGMTYRPGHPDWPSGLVPHDKFSAKYRKWDDGRGYTFEYRIPWSTFGVGGPPTPGGTVAGTTQVLWSQPDGLSHIRVNGNAYDIIGSDKGYPFQTTECWGKIFFAKEGHVSRDLVEAGVPGKRQTPLTFTYDLAMDGEVTLQLEKPDGTVVRILEAQEARKAGKIAVSWDGLTDWGDVLPAGDYRWRGIVAPTPVKADYRFSAHNSGRPPYTTDDGKGGWGGDHGVPRDALALPDGLLLSWDGAEFGSGAIRVDLDGNKQWGIPTTARHLATDGKRFYSAGDHHRHGNRIVFFGLEDARPAVLGNDVSFFEPPQGGEDNANHVSGLLWHDNILYASYRDRNLIALFSTEDGSLKRTLEMPAPERLAVTSDGNLLVVSAGKVMSLRIEEGGPSGKASILIENHLDAPQGITVGGDGTIYVANRGELQNVSVFDKNGTYLRSIGKTGGRPRIGAYDELGMLHPGGIALDTKGRLWVAETLKRPKRISVWNATDGTYLEEFLGAAEYMTFGDIDPNRPNELLAEGVIWQIDWENNKTTPKFTTWRRSGPNGVPYANSNPTRLLTADNGKQYLWGAARVGRYRHPILMYRDGDRFKPFVGIFNFIRDEDTGIALFDEDHETFPRVQRGLQPSYVWQDRNDDQTVQAEEVTRLRIGRRYPDYDRVFISWVEDDLTLRLHTGHLWKPTGFNPQGHPVYDPLQPAKAAAAGRPSYTVGLEDQTLITLDWINLDREDYKPCLIRWSEDGEMLWNYPNLIPWKQSLSKSLVKAGRLWAMTGVSRAGDFFTVDTYWGPIQIFRTDGQYVGQILHDRRLVSRGPYAGSSEGQFAGFTKLNLDGKERYFSIAGSNDVRVWEVLGLDTLENLPGSTYAHTEAAVAKAQAAKEAYEASMGAARTVRIVPGGKAALESAPEVVRELEDKRGFKVRLAYDANSLYARFDVKTPSLLLNMNPDPHILFRSGNLLDLQLATDPKADPKRTTPAPGDLRLLVSQREGKPFAVLFRPKVKSFKGKPVVLKSPTGQESFDRIEEVNVTLEHRKTKTGFTATVTVPHALTGLSLKPGQKVKLDLGYIFGNSEGTRSTLRAYLFNDSFTANVVDDIPHESRLEPAEWGEAEVK